MIKTVAGLAALLAAAAMLYSGNGLQFTLLSMRADIENFSTPLIGAMMAAYYVGFIVGCRVNPTLIASVGHIRTFVALASIASATALAHAILVDVFGWSLLRAISGFCFAGMTMVLESWINERVSNSDRGRVLSIYRIVDLLALTAGNAMIAMANPVGFQLFALTSILISIALVPVALTRSESPKPVIAAKLDLSALIKISPVGAVGAFIVGLANAGFWSVGPIFVQRVGYDADIVSAFMISVILGAAVSQWPLGFLSDKIDRRSVISGAGFSVALTALALASFGATSELHLLAIAFAMGAVMLPMFGLCIAHANDLSDPDEAVKTNGGLLLLHGVGAVIGTITSASIMAIFGPESLFVFVAGSYGFLAMFSFYRKTQSKDVTNKTPFAPIARGSAPTIFEIIQEDNANAASE